MSMEIGYALSSEEHGPNDLVRYARRAEESGFSFALISDHYHPWVSKQGHSPFVWSVIGAIAHATTRLRLGTGVTCPIRRLHPAIVAQAAATAAAMMPGRFFLGVGSGENLNEHIIGDAWPPPSERLEMLEEAIEVIRALWKGEEVTHDGEYFVVDEARLYTLPDEPPPIYVAGSGKKAAELAARVGDGLISIAPDAEIVEVFTAGANGDAFERKGTGKQHREKPRLGQFACCYARDEKKAARIAHEYWPTAGLHGSSKIQWETKTPEIFEEIVKNVGRDDVAETVLCGADPARHLDKIREFADAGFDHVYVHQVGPEQDAFFEFYETEVIPKLE